LGGGGVVLGCVGVGGGVVLGVVGGGGCVGRSRTREKARKELCAALELGDRTQKTKQKKKKSAVHPDSTEGTIAKNNKRAEINACSPQEKKKGGGFTSTWRQRV